MNHTTNILLRAIPLAMALVCFLYGSHIFLAGDDSSRQIAGPTVFYLGMVCIALYSAAATALRQARHLQCGAARYLLPGLGYTAALATFVSGIVIFAGADTPGLFAAGHIVAGLGLVTAGIATVAAALTKLPLIAENSGSESRAAHKEGFTYQQELLFEATGSFLSILAWAWAVILLAGGTEQHFVAGSVMGGIACVSTSLTALTAGIVRQERNVYTLDEKKTWPRVALATGGIALLWGIVVTLLYMDNPLGFAGFVQIALGLVCFSVAGCTILLANGWKSDRLSKSPAPLVPVIGALACLLLAGFLFEDGHLTAARIGIGLGAACFSLFPLLGAMTKSLGRA